LSLPDEGYSGNALNLTSTFLLLDKRPMRTMYPLFYASIHNVRVGYCLSYIKFGGIIVYAFFSQSDRIIWKYKCEAHNWQC